jgi:hypothetical protein
MPRVARCAWSVCTECGSGQIPPKRLNAMQRGPEWPPQWEPGAPCPNKFPCHNVIKDKWRTRWFCSSAFPGVTVRPEYDWCWVLSSSQEEGFIFSDSFRGFSQSQGRVEAQQKSSQYGGQEGEWMPALIGFSFFIQSGSPAYGMVPSIFR